MPQKRSGEEPKHKEPLHNIRPCGICREPVISVKTTPDEDVRCPCHTPHSPSSWYERLGLRPRSNNGEKR